MQTYECTVMTGPSLNLPCCCAVVHRHGITSPSSEYICHCSALPRCICQHSLGKLGATVSCSALCLGFLSSLPSQTVVSKLLVTRRQRALLKLIADMLCRHCNGCSVDGRWPGVSGTLALDGRLVARVSAGRGSAHVSSDAPNDASFTLRYPRTSRSVQPSSRARGGIATRALCGVMRSR